MQEWHISIRNSVSEKDSGEWISANDLAGADPDDQKSFRRALRRARLRWHVRNSRRLVQKGSSEYEDMKAVYNEWAKRK
jgi:uncharacterized protein with von Willebrand factor type A (vWA) domain